MNALRHYVLDGKQPRAVDDVLEWARAFEGHRHVAVSWGRGGERVSTVFLGLDHQFGEGPPLLFETMIFGGKHDEYCDRYATWEAAEAGHARACYLAEIPYSPWRSRWLMFAERMIRAWYRLTR